MAIKEHFNRDFDSVVDVEHTGDTNWQVALTVTGKGKAEIHFSMSVSRVGEYKITIDGTLLLNGAIGFDNVWEDYVYTVKWNVSLLVEYRTNNAANTSYCDIAYYNR